MDNLNKHDIHGLYELDTFKSYGVYAWRYEQLKNAYANTPLHSIRTKAEKLLISMELTQQRIKACLEFKETGEWTEPENLEDKALDIAVTLELDFDQSKLQNDD